MENYIDYGINFSVNTNYEESISKFFNSTKITYKYIFYPFLKKYLYFNNKILMKQLSEYDELAETGISIATWEFGYSFKDHGFLYHEMSDKLKSVMNEKDWESFKGEVLNKLNTFMNNSIANCDVLTFSTLFGPGATKLNRRERYDKFVNAYQNIQLLSNVSETNSIKSTYYISNFKSKFSIEKLDGEFNHKLLSETSRRTYKLYHVDKISTRVFISDKYLYSPVYYGKLNGDLCTIYLGIRMHN